MIVEFDKSIKPLHIQKYSSSISIVNVINEVFVGIQKIIIKFNKNLINNPLNKYWIIIKHILLFNPKFIVAIDCSTVLYFL